MPRPNRSEGTSRLCRLVEEGFGPTGAVPVRAERVVTGLEVPWGLAFLPDGEWLVTERPGRLRLVTNGQLAPEPVATVTTADTAEGGLLGIAPHPEFATNRLVYLYVTLTGQEGPTNRVERWQLSEDNRSAERERVLLDGIPAARFHNGGRIGFGPDGMLYIGTGDAREVDSSQDRSSPSGKILRVTPDGEVPEDNPFPSSPAFVTGIRNTEGFDWLDEETLLVVDHGPSGELLRSGHDEVNVARGGDNLGWPTIYGCQSRNEMVSPSLTWEEAVPPGGAAIYTGDRIAEWKGSLIIGTLGSRHLHRVELDSSDPRRVNRHEVYFHQELGRLRTVAMGPDGELYVTTSNCDGRGDCPAERDAILRIVQ